MNTAEAFAKNILLEKKGVYILAWTEKQDLVRALLVIHAVLSEIQIKSMLLEVEATVHSQLRDLFQFTDKNNAALLDSEDSLFNREDMLLLYLQQASSTTIGPILNGWRSSIASSPGAILVVRSADLLSLERNAPDMASFVGPRISETTSFLSIWSKPTGQKLNNRLPKSTWHILGKLPGKLPQQEEINAWIAQHPPEE